MAWHVLEVTGPSLAYIVLGGFVVVFSMVSLLVKERLYLNEVVLGTAFGILMGPHVTGAFDPRSWGHSEHEITLEVMRIVLATGLFAIGVELPKAYLREHIKGLTVMVVPTMAFGWVIVAGVMKALLPQLTFVSCLAISACLTPTDPIICAAIVGGKFAIKHVPTNLRHILSAESAANDGLAYPFLTLALYLTVDSTTKGAIGHWFVVGWLYQVILGTIIGAVIGLSFCHLMKFTHRKGYIDRESYVAQYLALTFLTMGICSTLGADDLLGAFAAGSAISWDGHFNSQVEGEVFATVIDLVLNCGCFVYIGAWLPFDSYNMPELGIEPWKLVVLFIAILILRRIPALLLIYKFVPEIETWREALFSGHFGPMGVGAVFISTLALHSLPEASYPPENQAELLALTIQPIVSFVVLCSILIHGLSIPFFTLSRRVGTRTLSVRQTITSNAPDWLFSTRRIADSPIAGSQSDAENGVRSEARTPAQSARVSLEELKPAAQPEVMVHDNDHLYTEDRPFRPDSTQPDVLNKEPENGTREDGAPTASRTVRFPEEGDLVTGDMGERQTGTGLRTAPGLSTYLPSGTQTPKEVEEVEEDKTANAREGSEMRERKPRGE